MSWSVCHEPCVPWSDVAEQARKLFRNLALRLEHDASSVSQSVLEGLDEILTVSRLRLLAEAAPVARLHSHFENMMGRARSVTPT
jgi:putative transposase